MYLSRARERTSDRPISDSLDYKKKTRRRTDCMRSDGPSVPLSLFLSLSLSGFLNLTSWQCRNRRVGILRRTCCEDDDVAVARASLHSLRGRKEAKKEGAATGGICKKSIAHRDKEFSPLGNGRWNEEKEGPCVPGVHVSPFPVPSSVRVRRFVSFSISNRIAVSQSQRRQEEETSDLLLYNTQLPQQLLPFAHKRDRASEGAG